MAEITMVVTAATKAGILDKWGDANVELGNAAGGNDFIFPNDGKVVLEVNGVTGDTFTFTPVVDKYGRTEVLAPVVVAGNFATIGPFDPQLWNDSDGMVHFVPTAGNVGDLLLAMSVKNYS